jgi:hypothetical protein
MALRDWSTDPATNGAYLFAENQAPSSVNNNARTLMSDVRAWYEAPGWTDLGHTPTRIDNDTFTVATDLTATYVAGRRLKFTGGATSYGTVSSSSYSVPTCTVNVTMDSGNLPNPLTTVALGYDLSTGAVQPYYRITAAEISAGVTPTNYQYEPGDIRRYGAVGDGSTSDYAAWVSAALVGGKIIVPENFNSAIASASLSSTGIALLSNTVIRGAGRDTSKITVTGATACNLFRTLNKQGITLEDVTLRQNGVNTSSVLGQFLYFEQSTAAVAVGGLVRVQNCRFENCKGDSWLGIYNDSTTHDLREVRINNCEFVSESGNARGPTNVGISSTLITLGDSAGASTRLITDVHIKNCTAYGEHVKTFVACWHNTSRVQIHDNILNNFHSNAAFSAEDVALYVLLAYKGVPGTSIAPDLIDISGNTVNGFVDAGVYVVAANRLTIRGNNFAGGIGTTDATLPKGAIAINECDHARCYKNDIDNCARGISGIVGTGDVFTFIDTVITSPPASAVSSKITAVSGATNGKLYIDGITIETGTTTVGMDFDFGSTFGLAVLDVRNFSVEGSTSSIRFRRSNSTVPAMDEIVFQNGSVRGGSTYGITFENYTDTDQRATFANITIADITSTAYGLGLDASVGLDVHDITFRDVGASAFALSMAGATGTLSGIRYQNVADADRIRNSGGVDLGQDTPTHSGNIGDFVQRVDTADHDGNNMTLVGWRNYNGSTGWRAQYVSSVTPAT